MSVGQAKTSRAREPRLPKFTVLVQGGQHLDEVFVRNFGNVFHLAKSKSKTDYLAGRSKAFITARETAKQEI